MMNQAMVGSVGLRRTQKGRVVVTLQTLSDGEVIDSVRKGERDAYRIIVDRYKRRAYHMALGLVRNPQDALDVSQTAFIKAYRNIKRFDTAKPFLPWFYKILRNLCLDHLRRSRRRHEVSLTEALVVADDRSRGEITTTLGLAIDDLAVEQREVLMLHYFEGLSYKEISIALGKPIGTVMSTLYHARRKLREAFMGRVPGSERGDG
jgi:RNA polymerase sigma-70 factor (ECF subfamily)